MGSEMCIRDSFKRHVTAKKRADEAEQKTLEGVAEEAAMGRYQKM